MDEEFDLNAFNEQWEAEMSEIQDDATEAEMTETDEVEETKVVEDGAEAETEAEAATDTTGSDDIPDMSEEQKRNAAFAQLRRERDEAAKQASFLQKLADENGMTVDDIVKRYEDAKLEEEAETKNVPVEVLQRLKQLENENLSMKSQSFNERFNSQVEATMKAYNATEQDLEKTFEYAHQNGLIDVLKSGTTSFEAVYKMAHMDTLIDNKVNSALQESLSNKKKRQQESSLHHGSGADFTTESLEDRAVADAKKFLDRM